MRLITTGVLPALLCMFMGAPALADLSSSGAGCQLVGDKSTVKVSDHELSVQLFDRALGISGCQWKDWTSQGKRQKFLTLTYPVLFENPNNGQQERKLVLEVFLFKDGELQRKLAEHSAIDSEVAWSEYRGDLVILFIQHSEGKSYRSGGFVLNPHTGNFEDYLLYGESAGWPAEVLDYIIQN